MKRNAIIRNNRDYLVENIEPTEEFIALLLSVHCLTDERVLVMNRLELDKDKNSEILDAIASADETGYMEFIKCLRKTNQRKVATVIENGGVVVKVELACIPNDKRTVQCLNQALSSNLTKAGSGNHRVRRRISELEDEGIYMLSCCTNNRRRIVLWMWCQSQNSLEKLHELYDSNRIFNSRDLVQYLFTSHGKSNNCASVNCKIYQNQFERKVAIRPTAITFKRKLEVEDYEVWGVTLLQGKIYVLCTSTSIQNTIHVYEDRHPFQRLEIVTIDQIESCADIASSETENCLYVVDSADECLWKMTTDHQVIRWLSNVDWPFTISVTNDGRLLMTKVSEKGQDFLEIYGPDASLLRSLVLPVEIFSPRHAMETSDGNFIIIHELKVVIESSEKFTWAVSELTSSGDTVVRRFIPSDKMYNLVDPCHLLLDPDNRVFVSDRGNNGVILFDSRLKWDQVIIPTNEDDEDEVIYPLRLCYSEELGQLMVGGGFLKSNGVQIYAVKRI